MMLDIMVAQVGQDIAADLAAAAAERPVMLALAGMVGVHILYQQQQDLAAEAVEVEEVFPAAAAALAFSVKELVEPLVR
jgi:cobyric acid synthase